MPAEGGAHVVVPSSAVVLAAGDPVPAALLPDVADAIDAATLTVAADGGIAHAHRAGHQVDVLVGDLDSTGARALARAREAGTEVLTHPRDKAMTDLDLALTVVLDRLAVPPVDHERPRRPDVLVVGGHGGRLDHLIGNLLVLAADRYAPLRLRAWWGTDVVHLVRDEVTLTGSPGATVTLLALHGAAEGVTTTGLRFPLDDAVLAPGSSLGVSNELVAPTATVRVRRGVLAAIQTT